MDKSQRDHRQQQQLRHQNRENPSFSSSLLDAIYRSIDEGEKTMKKKKQKQSNSFFDDDDDDVKDPNFLRSRKVEDWMDKRVCEKVDVRRNSLHSSSSSSDSSSNGGFSSSESSSELFNNGVRPKPIRTSFVLPSSQNSNFDSFNGYRNNLAQPQKPRIENEFQTTTTTKKKMKFKAQKKPISPGARLASFLNSLFNSGIGNSNNNSNTKKKAKLVSSSSNTMTQTQPFSQTPTCSSASSFSRSCLSKTPSSSRSGGNKINRSVRFYPISVIVDEDCRPCGHKNLHHEGWPSARNSYQIKSKESQMHATLPLQTEKLFNEELRVRVMEESKRVEEFARDLLKNYQRKREESNKDLEMMMNYNEEEEEEEDDASSCSSSDLFELDNLSAIGNIERYREELPVYETTHFNTNRAIANGFMM